MRRGGIGHWSRSRRSPPVLLGTVSLAALTAGAALAQNSEPTQLPEVRVVAPSPVSTGTRPRQAAPKAAPARRTTAAPRPAPEPAQSEPGMIDRDKVPSNIQTLTSEDFSRTYTPSVTEALMQRV